MFCRNCGSEVADDGNFCSNCGSDIARDDADGGQIKGQDETAAKPPAQEPSYNLPPQPSGPYTYMPTLQSPNRPPAGGGTWKRLGGRGILIIILTILLVAGIGVNIFQAVQGTHILSGQSTQVSYYKTPDASVVVDTDQWGAVPLNQLLVVFNEVETAVNTEPELAKLLETTLATSGVETAFPSGSSHSLIRAGRGTLRERAVHIQ